jgi:WD40 repeat protein
MWSHPIWKRWQVGAASSQGDTLATLEENVMLSKPSADGRVVLALRPRNRVEVWDAGGEHACGPAVPVDDWMFFGQLSPNGDRLWTSDRAGGHLWDVSAGKEIATFATFQPYSRPLAFSPDGKRLAVLTSKNLENSGKVRYELQIASTATGEILRLLLEADNSMSVAAYMAVGAASKAALVLTNRLAEPSVAAFSPDGKMLATGAGRAVQRWDVETGKAVGDPIQHPGGLGAVLFSADG